MRFRFIFIIALILFILLAKYAKAETITLKVGQSKIISGKNVSVTAVYSEFIVVNADGTQKDINVITTQNASGVTFSSHTTYVNGVNITVTDLFERQQTVQLDVRVGFDCGDNICSSAETSAICCKDCSCSLGYTCIDNQCIESGLNQCNSSAQCDDNNQCTVDSCEGIPRKCYNVEILTCFDNDDCCPEKCYYENDFDCPRNKTKFECFSSKDCIDVNACTFDYCEDGKCKHDIKQGCEFNETCLPINSTGIVNGTASYCNPAGWQKQKSSGDCLENFECLSNICEDGKCKANLQEKENVQAKGNAMLFLSIVAILLFAVIIYLFLKLKKR